ncbi:MAG: recombination protein O N-terminal domain-containing protein, partial [bacterium]|nr:recombination protein O N-terminal domain-containing protein [bacterium]
MTFKATGYIIGKKYFREADRLYTIYTAEYGKIEAMAQGVRKLSSKLAGHLELFHKASFTIAKGKQIDRIATVDT